MSGRVTLGVYILTKTFFFGNRGGCTCTQCTSPRSTLVSIHWYQKGNCSDGSKVEIIAENLLEILEPKFKVDPRAVRDRYQLLAQKLRKKL